NSAGQGGEGASPPRGSPSPVGCSQPDRGPADPPVTIELSTKGGSVLVEATDGTVHTRPADTRPVNLVLAGPPSLILGVLTRQLTLAEARRRGLKTRGDIRGLSRPPPADPPPQPPTPPS